MAGVDAAGFVKKTTDEILTGINNSQLSNISPVLNQSSSSVLGVLNGVVAAAAGEGWDVLEAVYLSQYPDTASGDALTQVCLITGTQKNGETKTVVRTVTVNLNATTTLPAGSVAHINGDPTARFVTLTDVSNPGGAPANVSVDFEAEEAGPVQALAGTLTVIAEPVTGWNSVTNPTDGVLGSDVETDPALRLRRELELAGGSTTVDAIRTDILQKVDDVVSVKVLENDTDAIDANGLPRKSFEVIAYGPDPPVAADDQEVAEQIFLSKPAGILSFGTTSKTVVDDQGKAHTISFTRPTVRNVWIEVDIQTDSSVYPANGNILVAAAIVAVGDTSYQAGDDVILAKLKAAVFTIPGIVDITAMRAGFAAFPVGIVNLAIGVREIANLDTSRTTVVSTPVL